MLRYRSIQGSLFFLLLMLTARLTQANDTNVTLGAGGLVPTKSSTIVVQSEKLRISLHQVTVDYVFRNTSTRDIDTTVAFPFPELDGATLEIEPIELPSKDAANFMSFKVTVNGTAISPQVEIRAFKKDKDITERLRALGLPASVLDPAMKSAIERLPQAQRGGLEKEELIFEDGGQSGGKTDKWIWPWWQTRIQFYWAQHFPANTTVRISHSYVPVVGGSYIVDEDDGSFIGKPYCGTSANFKQIKELKVKQAKNQKGDATLWWHNVKYILTTANNWSGPIRDFHLEIDSDAPGDILLTCQPSIKQTSPTRYEVESRNFRPDRDLDLVIINAKQ